MGDNHIRIGSETCFRGTIYARVVTIEGMVKGEVTATHKVLIKNSGIVSGPIRTRKILLEEGARHEGMITLLDGEATYEEPQKNEDLSPQQNKKATKKKLQKSETKSGKRLL